MRLREPEYLPESDRAPKLEELENKSKSDWTQNLSGIDCLNSQ
jgi:hypothetical protein